VLWEVRVTRAQALGKHLAKLPIALEIAVALCASVAFALSFGLNYGVNNQVAYLLGSLRLVEPGILNTDWYATATTHYHPAFTYFGAALLAVDHTGWSIGIAQVVVITAGSMAIYFLLGQLSLRRTHALAAFLLLLAINFMTATRSVGGSYVFDMILQPSTLGSLGLLAAISFHVSGRWLASGVCLAFSGLFHANFLILGFPVFGLAQLALGKQELVRRLVRQLGPPCVVVLVLSPLLVKSAFSPHAAEAQRIYFTIRSPHHYLPSTYERDFTPLIGWHLLGVGAGWWLMRAMPGRTARLGALVLGMVSVLWVGTILTTAVYIPQVAQLFVWRLAPFCELLFQAAACAIAVRVVAMPRQAPRFVPAQLALLIAGLGVLCMFYGNHKQTDLPALLALVFAAAAATRLVVVGATELAARVPATERSLAMPARLWAQGGSIVLVALAALLAYTAGEKPVDTVKQRSTLFRGLSSQERELYAWMQHSTAPSTLFLSPPNIETLRYHGKRPIVVDWKSSPIIPDDVIEWYHRIQDVTGRPRFSSSRDLDGYESMSEERMLALREKYRFSYVIVRRGRERAFPTHNVAYRNGQFAVVDVR
jgi:hypothetical protein